MATSVNTNDERLRSIAKVMKYLLVDQNERDEMVRIGTIFFDNGDFVRRLNELKRLTNHLSSVFLKAIEKLISGEYYMNQFAFSVCNDLRLDVFTDTMSIKLYYITSDHPHGVETISHVIGMVVGLQLITDFIEVNCQENEPYDTLGNKL